MAYLTYTVDPIGSFVEKDVGNTFEYSFYDEQGDMPQWPHRVWVASGKICLLYTSPSPRDQA